ncbi:MAG: endonuclease/exonuclease/phosphatase family protein [Pseudomonadota bacterium]|nr:endonuclease/exonuclease/phosphatase family protein [Pseudomonadota bacterium]
MSATRDLSDADVPDEAEAPPAPGVRRIAIGSYNIHSCIGLDRKRSPARIASVLKELDCDIYALQEVDNEPGADEASGQLEFLSEAMDMAAVPGMRIVRHSGEYGNALLTRFPVNSVHRHDLSYGKWLEPRGALDVELDVGGRALRVIATHLGLSRSERRFQWQQLLAAIASSPPDHPTIMLGDMNEWFPRAGTLRDAHNILGEALAPPEFPSFWPFLALTRIWVRPVDAIVAVKVHNTPLAKRASDHLPLRAEIDVERFAQRAPG